MLKVKTNTSFLIFSWVVLKFVIMALEFIGGTLFTLLYDGVKKAMGRSSKFKSVLEDLNFTLDCLQPLIIQQIGEHNRELGLPDDEIQNLQRQMEAGVKLVCKLSKVGMWKYCCFVCCSCCNCIEPSYTDQVAELDRSLRRLLERMRLQEARDVKELLLLGRRNAEKLDQLERRQSELLKMQQEAMDILRAQQGARDVREFSASNTESMVHQRIEGNGVQQVGSLDGGGGAVALGAIFQVLFDAVMQVKDKAKISKRVLEDLKYTLDVLKPLIEEMTEDNKVLHLPKELVENFRIQMEKGVEFVNMFSRVHQRASYKKYKYTSKLFELDKSLRKLLSILKAQIASHVKKTLVSISKIEMEIKKIEKSGVVENQHESKIWCPVPDQPPSPTVRMDALNVQGAKDVKETLDLTGVERIEGSGVEQNQSEVAVAEPPSRTAGQDILNVQGSKDVRETLDLACNIESGVKGIEESGVVQDQIDVALADPPSPTVGMDVLNVQLSKDMETLNLAANKEAVVEQIEESGVNMQRDGKETLVSVSDIETEVKLIERIPPVAEFEFSLDTDGLDEPLRELKRMLLKDEVSELVLTGPEGCGKTTLAKMFCQDEEVKDKFKNNIFFVSVPENPNLLDHIIQQLYHQHKGSQAPAMQDEAIALNWLQQFLKETGQLPSLLVLDDVWPGSEFFLDMFDEFKTSNYTILVTSIYEFPRFGSSYYVKSLKDEVAMTPSNHSTSLAEKRYSWFRSSEKDMEASMTSYSDLSKFWTESYACSRTSSEGDVGIEGIEGNDVVQNRTPSPKFGFDAMNMQRTRDGKESLGSVSNMDAGIRRIEGIASVSEYECLPRTVELDAPLMELKTKLLKNDLSVLVLTGPEGCGKTTLARKFCHDEEVKDKFKNNIFFVPVSENPNLNLIVHKLYQHRDSDIVPALQDEAIALNCLQHFLMDTGRYPSLLVLDDVWPGSESLLDKFDEFKTPNYKIVVTSRFEFPRFGCSFYLKSLNVEDVTTFSHLSASLGKKSSDVPKDLGKKLKVVLKVDSSDGKTIKKAMKAISALDGVDSITWEGKDKKLTVVGSMDVISVARKLRKLYRAELISVSPYKQGKETTKTKNT